MKKIFAIAAALLGVLALGAQAHETGTAHSHEEQHYEGDGHDHSHDAKRGPESNADYFWRKSDEAFHAGNYERAVGLHRAIVALDPTDVESFSVAAWLIWSMGKKEEALAHIDRGLKANPDNWEMWDAAGQHYDLQKRENAALNVNAKDAYARAVALAPADGPATQMLRRRLAHAAEKADDLTLSIATWRKLVEDYPDDVVNKNNLARVEKLRDEKQLTAAVPFVVGAAGLGLAALVGGAIHRLRRNASVKNESPQKPDTEFRIQPAKA